MKRTRRKRSLLPCLPHARWERSVDESAPVKKCIEGTHTILLCPSDTTTDFVSHHACTPHMVEARMYVGLTGDTDDPASLVTESSKKRPDMLRLHCADHQRPLHKVAPN